MRIDNHKKTNPPRLLERKNKRITTISSDYSGDASTLFGNLRIPASLFAGASATSAFALPLSESEGITSGIVKRAYSILMIGSLSSQIITLVVSTTTMSLISINHQRNKDACALDGRDIFSLGQFLDESYELEWTAARLFFLSGLISFSIAVGLRAWITISCPIISWTALGCILSSAIYCLAFIQNVERKIATQSNLPESIMHLPSRFCTLMARNISQSSLFTLASMIAIISFGFMSVNIPGIIISLEAGS